MKQKKKIPRLFTINDNTVLRIVPSLAEEIGLNESILLLQIDFLKSISNTEEKKGRPWTYQSIRQLQIEYFPFWSKDTINRTIASLQKMRLIRCDNFNKAAYDRTRWISINYGKVRTLKAIQVGGLSQNATRSTQNATRSTQNATTIPETPTETPTEKNTPPKGESLTVIHERELDQAIDYIFTKTGVKLKKDKWLRIWWFNAIKIDELIPLKYAIRNYCESKINQEMGKWDWVSFFKIQAKRAGYFPKTGAALSFAGRQVLHSDSGHGVSDEEFAAHMAARDAG